MCRVFRGAYDHVGRGVPEFEVEGRVFDYGVGVVFLGEAIARYDVNRRGMEGGTEEEGSQTC